MSIENSVVEERDTINCMKWRFVSIEQEKWYEKEVKWKYKFYNYIQWIVDATVRMFWK